MILLLLLLKITRLVFLFKITLSILQTLLRSIELLRIDFVKLLTINIFHLPLLLTFTLRKLGLIILILLEIIRISIFILRIFKHLRHLILVDLCLNLIKQLINLIASLETFTLIILFASPDPLFIHQH